MTRAHRWISRPLTWPLSISPDEATFARRGFHAASPAARERLERIGRTFLEGYHHALCCDQVTPLQAALDTVPSSLRGFAYEGAGMALTLLDFLTPWRRDRLAEFLRGPASAHTYMVIVGAGWAMARLRRRLDAPPPSLDPLLGWLALDGYGFHEGYFHAARTIERGEVPARLSGYARRAFDQGLGRSLWFVLGTDVERIAAAVARLGRRRAADLWSGVGLACAYAGGADPCDVATAAGGFLPSVAQGAAFAAKARERAGNPVPHTDVACRVLCGVPAAEAAGVTDEALEHLRPDPPLPSYEVWRQRIRDRFLLASPRT
jgi:hypothetical protein